MKDLITFYQYLHNILINLYGGKILFKKRYLFMAIFVSLFVISTVSAEEISNETISYDSSLMTDSVSEYDLSM